MMTFLIFQERNQSVEGFGDVTVPVFVAAQDVEHNEDQPWRDQERALHQYIDALTMKPSGVFYVGEFDRDPNPVGSVDLRRFTVTTVEVTNVVPG